MQSYQLTTAWQKVSDGTCSMQVKDFNHGTKIGVFIGENPANIYFEIEASEELINNHFNKKMHVKLLNADTATAILMED